MSVIGNIIGMPPGAGGSFPFAGTRPKIKKTLFVANGSSSVWVAPPGVYHVILQMVGAGGGGGCAYWQDPGGGVAYAQAQGGGGAAAIAPSVIQVNPGTRYTLIAGRGGAPGTDSLIAGRSGSNSIFMSDDLYIQVQGGGGGRVTFQQTTGVSAPGLINNGGVSPGSVLGLIGISGGGGGTSQAFTAANVNISISMSGKPVDYSVGGLGTSQGPDTYISTNIYTLLGGGGASLYGSGSAASNNVNPPAHASGFGAGGGAGLNSNMGGSGRGASGSGGFIRILWEE